MALKFLLLMVIAAAAAKGCNLDLILEDLYDYTESEEDTPEEKPHPSTTASPTSPPPGGITSRPFPVTPMQNNANATPAPPNNPSAPNNNSSAPNNPPAANSTSRALNFKTKTNKGLHRRRSTHRRHVIRRIPLEKDALGRSTLTELNNLFAGMNQRGVAGRYAAESLGLPMREKSTLLMKDNNKEQKSIKLNHLRSDEEGESVLLIPLEELRSSIDRDSKISTQKHSRRNSAEDQDRYGLDEILYLPVEKSFLNNQRYVQDHKRSPHKPLVNRRPEYHVREEQVDPLIGLISLVSQQREEEEDERDDEDNPFYLMLVSEALPEKDDSEDHYDHVMLQLQNPRKPLIMHPDDLSSMEKLDESSTKKPTVDYINKVKEHIVRESTKINPVDRSEILSIFEQFRTSFLKNPKSPADDDTVGDIRYKPVVIEESKTPEGSQIFLALLDRPLEASQDKPKSPGGLLQALKPPTMNKPPQWQPNMNKTQHDLQPNKKPAESNTQILVERPMVIIQELPENDCKNHNCQQGSPIIITNSRVLIKNGKITEEAKLENSTQRNHTEKNDEMRLKTGLLDAGEVDKIYQHSHSVPIKYPINNPKIRKSPQQAVIQEWNFYANPHDTKREEMQGTKESMMDHHEEMMPMMHPNQKEGMKHEHQEMRPDHESMSHQNHDMMMNHEHQEMRPDHESMGHQNHEHQEMRPDHESMSHQNHEMMMNHEHQEMRPDHGSMGHQNHDHQEMRPDHESMSHKKQELEMNHEHQEMRPDHESMSHQNHELVMNHEHQGMSHESQSSSMSHEDSNKPHEGSSMSNQEEHNMFSEQRLPLIDMINGFNGHMEQHSVGHHDDGLHRPMIENSTVSHKIINAV